MKYLFFILLVVLPSFLFAQTDSIKSIRTLDEIDVSTTKKPVSKKNIAQQTATIYKDEIQKQNFQNTADVLGNSGAISLQKSQQGGGSPVIRGFEANRVLLVVDGVRMNNLIFRGGHLQNCITVDENILERADILYGPASTIYGSDALGGAVHFHTIQPKLAATTSKSITGNAFGRYSTVNKENKGHIDLNYATQRFASLTSITYSKFGDLRMGATANGRNSLFGTRDFYVRSLNGVDTIIKNDNNKIQVGSAYTQYDIMQKFLYKQNELITHDINVQYSTTGNVPRYDRLTDPNGTTILSSAEWYYGPQRRLLAGYNLNHKNIYNGIEMHVGLHYQDVEESRINRNFGSPSKNVRIENVSIFNTNIDFEKKLGHGNLLFGAENSYEMLQSKANKITIATSAQAPLSTRYPNGNNTLNRSEAYLNYNHSYNDKIKSTHGFRLGTTTLKSEHIDTLFYKLPYNNFTQNFFTYSLQSGLVVLLNNFSKLNATISTGFRTPNFDDATKIFDSKKGYVVVPNASLTPEQTITIDVGFACYNTNKIYWENTVYYTSLNNFISIAPSTFQGKDSVKYDGVMSKVFANQNTKKGYVYGYSTTLKMAITDHLLAYGSLNFTYGNVRDTVKIPLDHIPPMFGRAGLKYENKHAFLDVFTLYNGAKPIADYSPSGEDNPQYAAAFGAPAWFTCNIKASYKLNKNSTLQSGIDNILDLNYRTFSSGINAPGRNIYAALRVTF